MMRWLVALVLAGGVAAVDADAAFGGAAWSPPASHEILSERPSGFWTSNRPAEGGAYRWRLLGLGVVIAVGTGYAIVRLIKRASSERQAR
jgi:hypothetical protein